MKNRTTIVREIERLRAIVNMDNEPDATIAYVQACALYWALGVGRSPSREVGVHASIFIDQFNIKPKKS